MDPAFPDRRWARAERKSRLSRTQRHGGAPRQVAGHRVSAMETRGAASAMTAASRSRSSRQLPISRLAAAPDDARAAVAQSLPSSSSRSAGPGYRTLACPREQFNAARYEGAARVHHRVRGQ